MKKNITLAIILALILAIIVISGYVFMRYNEERAISAISETYDEIECFEVSDKILILNGWVGVEELSVMSEPSESSEVVDSLLFNEEIEYTIYNGNWFEIVNCDVNGYVSSEHILDKDAGYMSYDQYVLDIMIGYNLYDAPYTSGFKSYMDYRTITLTSSRQYKLQNGYAETGDYGIRMVDGRYCVAVGSYFSDDIGQYLDLILENGTVIPCILADQKADVHTDSNNIITMHNGCMSEFVVDANFLNNSVKKYGNISHCNDSWDSKVVAVKVYNKNIFEE